MDGFFESLRSLTWIEGNTALLPRSSYRHQVCIYMSALGRQAADFANGRHNYFATVSLTRPDGQNITQGVGIIPVLPNGRLLMVVEQRPAQSTAGERTAIIEGQLVSLGKYGSLEFPGGGVEPGQSIKSASFAELTEETETELDQQVEVWFRCSPVYPLGSDIVLRQHFAAAYLDGMKFSPQVSTDGGLRVVSMTPKEIQENIYLGWIDSVQAALMPWYFYLECQRAKSDPSYLKVLKETGYVEIQSLRVAR